MFYNSVQANGMVLQMEEQQMQELIDAMEAWVTDRYAGDNNDDHHCRKFQKLIEKYKQLPQKETCDYPRRFF